MTRALCAFINQLTIFSNFCSIKAETIKELVILQIFITSSYCQPLNGFYEIEFFFLLYEALEMQIAAFSPYDRLNGFSKENSLYNFSFRLIIFLVATALHSLQLVLLLYSLYAPKQNAENQNFTQRNAIISKLLSTQLPLKRPEVAPQEQNTTIQFNFNLPAIVYFSAVSLSRPRFALTSLLKQSITYMPRNCCLQNGHYAQAITLMIMICSAAHLQFFMCRFLQFCE